MEYNPKTDEIILFFTEELKRSIPENLKNIMIYGSRARTDFTEFSDYDFLILLKKKNDETSKKILDAGYNIFDLYSKLASCIIWDETEWEKKKSFSLGRKILQEGIIIV